jgi:hypothetical protein
MAISDALHTAYENLLRVIRKPLTAEEEAERARTGKGHPEVDPAAFCDRARQFVDALSADPAASAELARRGTLCVTLTREGSDYSIARTTAQEALHGWDMAAKPAQQPARLHFLQKTVGNLLKAAEEERVAGVRGRYEQMNRLLAAGPPEAEGLPEALRPLLENWRDLARSIVSKGEIESLDGCYWLLHVENLACDPENLNCAPENRNCAPENRKYVSAVLAAEVRQAAEAMVWWCRRQGTPGIASGQGGEPDQPSVPARGPGRVGNFHWDGKTATMAPQPWHLVKFLWGCKGHHVEIHAVAAGAWENVDATDNQIAAAASRASAAFTEAELPCSVNIKSGIVSLLNAD